jgi:hypothetical protein
MGIKNCTFSTVFSSVWVFASLAVINVTYAANEESLESQLKVYAQEAQEANLEQEIIAIIAEQIEEGSPDKLRAKYKSQVVADVETDNANIADSIEIKPTAEIPSVLNKDLKSAVEDAGENTDKKGSGYQKSIQPDNEASTSRPKADQVKTETPNKEMSTSRPKASQAKVKTETPARKPVTQKPRTTTASSNQPDRKERSTRTQKDRSSKKQGWIYVGQFSNNSWSEKMLRVDNDTLPKQGKDYLLNASVNIRDARPMKGRDLSPSVKILTSGDKIKLLKLHASGKKGHYWALIQWNR